MMRDLIVIPHEWLGLPVFGFGWALIVWLLFSIGLLVWLARRQGFGKETASYLPVMILVACAIIFLLPRIEQHLPTGEPIGLPIRGYGVMMLAGVICGVGLVVDQARRIGLDPDEILSLSFYVFIGGIVGARGFYVIQYWEQFQRDTLADTVAAVANVTQGGLVVYGSLIGASAAALWFMTKKKLPMLAIADLAAPGLMIGLALGRVGCLLNGCCHGGACDTGLTFPDMSPPYLHQRSHGQLYGFTIARNAESELAVVSHVRPESAADKAGLKVGDVITSIDGRELANFDQTVARLAIAPPDVTIGVGDKKLRIALGKFPPRSLPTRPAQIYAAINAALLCLLLWSYYPFRRRDGEVFALLISTYPITRILLEIIRNDEPGRFGTGMTISQIVSLAILIAAAGLWLFLRTRPPGTLHIDSKAK